MPKKLKEKDKSSSTALLEGMMMLFFSVLTLMFFLWGHLHWWSIYIRFDFCSSRSSIAFHWYFTFSRTLSQIQLKQWKWTILNWSWSYGVKDWQQFNRNRVYLRTLLCICSIFFIASPLLPYSFIRRSQKCLACLKLSRSAASDGNLLL